MHWRVNPCLLGLAAFSLCAFAQQTAPAVVESPTEEALRLLRTSVASASHFSPEENSDLLLDAAKAALPLDREAAAQWALELFYETDKLTPGNNRSAFQKNALVTLAEVDPVKASEMYMQQDDPPQPRLSEDIRAYGARSLFPALWSHQGVAALDRILAISDWLGSTGQYPYAAIAAILPSVKEKDPDKANEIFIEAVSYLGKGSDFSTTNSHYVDFLVKTVATAPPYALRAAIQKGLDAIEHSEEQKTGQDNQKPSFVYQLTTGKNSFEIHSQSAYLLYRLASIAGAVDPQWPAKIREHFSSISYLPELGASDHVTVAAAVSFGSSSSGSMASALGLSLGTQLQNLAQTDPQGAMDQAANIGDSTERSIAIAGILPYYAEKESSDPSGWLSKLEKTAESLPPGEAKLRLLVRLAYDELAMKREREGLATASHAFDLGEELFSTGMEANPGKMAYAMPGYDPLIELAGNLARLDGPARASALVRIQNLDEDVLRSHVQVAYADGLAHSRTAH